MNEFWLCLVSDTGWGLGQVGKVFLNDGAVEMFETAFNDSLKDRGVAEVRINAMYDITDVPAPVVGFSLDLAPLEAQEHDYEALARELLNLIKVGLFTGKGSDVTRPLREPKRFSVDIVKCA